MNKQDKNIVPRLGSASHMVEYKGYAIYMENYRYWVGLNPFIIYVTLQQAKNEVDRLTEADNKDTL